MGDTIELEFPARPQYLSIVRVLVNSLAQAAPKLESSRLDDLRIAVSEACTNAIDAYAAEGRTGAPVSVRVVVEQDRVEVEVCDQAGGFDPGALRPHPPVTKPARLEFERGLGIPLMKVLTDEVEFRTSNGGTAVRLVLFTPRTRC